MIDYENEIKITEKKLRRSHDNIERAILSDKLKTLKEEKKEADKAPAIAPKENKENTVKIKLKESTKPVEKLKPAVLDHVITESSKDENKDKKKKNSNNNNYKDNTKIIADKHNSTGSASVKIK